MFELAGCHQLKQQNYFADAAVVAVAAAAVADVIVELLTFSYSKV